MKLHPEVRAIIKLTDPMDAEKLTLADMRIYPYRLWMKFIEPKIVVLDKTKDSCWCYDVGKRATAERWSPQGWVTDRPDVEHPLYYNANLRRYVAKMFWKFPEEFSVYRDKEICTNANCLRPSHFIIAPHNNAKAKFG